MSIINSWHAEKVGARYYHALIGQVVAIVGFIVSITTTSTAPRYIACFLMYQVCFSMTVGHNKRPATDSSGVLQFRCALLLGTDLHTRPTFEEGRRGCHCEYWLQPCRNVSCK
jgi:hypothetical protein